MRAKKFQFKVLCMTKNGKKLLIVESPTKARTITRMVGNDFNIMASMGHIRDLPKSSLGIDVNDNFKPHYINIRGKGDVINELKKEAKNASKIFLATTAKFWLHNFLLKLFCLW